MEVIVKYKIAATAYVALVFLMCAGISVSQQGAHRASTKVAGTTASAPSARISWSSPRAVEVSDPVYQITAYTMELPSDWKFAGVIARPTGCHATGASLKFTAQTADGSTAIEQLPGVTWAWSTNPSMQRTMEQSHCPGVNIDSAASFLMNIAVPNLRPTAKVIEVLPLLPEGQASLADQLAKQREQNVAMARQYGQPPQKLSLDGARVRIQYDRDGRPVEEMIVSVVSCNEVQMQGLMGQPASQKRTCFSRAETIFRAPLGHLDEFMALPQIKGLGKTIQPNAEWQSRLSRDQQAAFQQAQAANNAQFQQFMKNNEAQHEQMLANGRAFQANQQASTDRALANDRAQQRAIDASAHATALYSLDRQEFKDPNTGKTIEASNQYNHQWISSDGSTLIQTNDHTYDPNGQVYAVSQSWTELVPK
jgi:hypothetical protein